MSGTERTMWLCMGCFRRVTNVTVTPPWTETSTSLQWEEGGTPEREKERGREKEIENEREKSVQITHE